MAIDYTRQRVIADRQIKKWGGLAYLRRANADRECYALEVQLSSHEKRALKNFNNRIFIISSLDLTVPPTREDSLVLVNDEGTKLPPLRQAAPVAPLQPKPGGIVIYYEMQIEGAAG